LADQELGGIVRDTMSVVNGAVVELPVQAIADLAGEDRVQWVEPPLPLLTAANLENRGTSKPVLRRPHLTTSAGLE
jgi:hypothetical protein